MTQRLHLERLREEDGRHKRDDHRRDPLLALDVTELDAVEGDEESADEHGHPQDHPRHDAHPPRERLRLLRLLLLQFYNVTPRTTTSRLARQRHDQRHAQRMQ